MGVVALAVAAAGFGPGFVSGHRNAPVTPLAWLHGALFTGWLLLYVAQTRLVAAHRLDLHRRLGIVGVALALAMVLAGSATTVAMGRRRFDLSGDLRIEADPLYNLVFPLGDLLSFAILASAALLYRRRGAVH
jgi:hypothetical protein